MTAARDTRVDGCAAPSDWFAVLPQAFPQRGWFCTWGATYKGRFCFKAMCAKGVVAKVMPGRVSGRGVGCRCFAGVVLLLAPRRDCPAAAALLPLPPRRDRPVAIALRATAKGRKRIPFRLRPSGSPLVGRFLFSESARHGLGGQPGRNGPAVEPIGFTLLPSEKCHRPLACTQRVDGEPQPAYLCVYWPWRLVLELR